MTSRRQMPTFKTLRPEPLDSPIYKGGYRVGMTAFGKKASTSPDHSAQKPETPEPTTSATKPA